MIWPKCLDKFITRIPLKSTKRVQACLINFPRTKILWLNSYFPTERQTPNFDDSELRETLAAIKNVIEKRPSEVHSHPKFKIVLQRSMCFKLYSLFSQYIKCYL